jgi:hypothetical protein
MDITRPPLVDRIALALSMTLISSRGSARFYGEPVSVSAFDSKKISPFLYK